MEEGSFKSTFNVALGLVQQIDEMLRAANREYIQGQIHEAWKRMKAIQMRIIQLIETDEKTKAELQELANKSGSVSKKAIFDVKYIDLASKFYEQYNNKLMCILHEKDLLLQGKKDGSVMNF